jgi:hypothetical protein
MGTGRRRSWCSASAFDAHHVAVFTPVQHVGALTEVNIAKGGVPVVAGTAQHDVFTVDAAWEEHPIAVEGNSAFSRKVNLSKS